MNLILWKSDRSIMCSWCSCSLFFYCFNHAVGFIIWIVSHFMIWSHLLLMAVQWPIIASIHIILTYTYSQNTLMIPSRSYCPWKITSSNFGVYVSSGFYFCRNIHSKCPQKVMKMVFFFLLIIRKQIFQMKFIYPINVKFYTLLTMLPCNSLKWSLHNRKTHVYLRFSLDCWILHECMFCGLLRHKNTISWHLNICIIYQCMFEIGVKSKLLHGNISSWMHISVSSRNI